MDETTLLRAACQGDIEAFNQLVFACQDTVFRQASWMLEDQVSAEAVTQDAFLRAYRNLDQFSRGSFCSWVLRIVTRQCLEALRRTGDRSTICLTSLNPDVEGTESAEGAIRSCLVDLPPADRAVLVLVDLQELDYVQAAAVLEIPVAEAARRLARARQYLSRLITSRRVYDHESA
jgi:RNA polymerase sigma-70 factor (ECF subfamily)